MKIKRISQVRKLLKNPVSTFEAREGTNTYGRARQGGGVKIAKNLEEVCHDERTQRDTECRRMDDYIECEVNPNSPATRTFRAEKSFECISSTIVTVLSRARQPNTTE